MTIEQELFTGYRTGTAATPASEATLASEADVLAGLIRTRIRELWRYRQWYRQHAMTLTWPVRWDNQVELRTLVRLARAARRHVEAEAAGVAVWHVGWTEAELRLAAGDR